MAINVEFDGWLNEVKTFDWGFVAKITHDQRAKNQAGEWETVGKDYIDVTLTSEQFAVVNGASKVHVVGTLKVDAYMNKNGAAKPSMKVRALEIRPVDRKTADPIGVVRDVLGMSEDAPF